MPKFQVQKITATSERFPDGLIVAGITVVAGTTCCTTCGTGMYGARTQLPLESRTYFVGLR